MKSEVGSWTVAASLGEYAATAAADQVEAKSYAIDGILPETGASIWFGPGSTGKTQLLLWMAAHLASPAATGPSTWMGAAIRRRGHILVLSAEDIREDIFLRINGIVRQLRREGHPDLDVAEICSRIHVLPFISMTEEEFAAPNPSLFRRSAQGEWVATSTLTDVEKFIGSWNRDADEGGRPDGRIIGVVVDSAVSMAGFELANSEATTNLLFRINRTSLRQDVFWAIIGHTPKDLKNDDPIDNAVARLRGSAMWSTSPRTVVELRTAGEHENITDVRRVYPEVQPRDIVIAMVVKANSKGADCRPRVLRRLAEGAFDDITDAFPSVCEGYASSPTKPASSAVEQRSAVISLIRDLTNGGTAEAMFTRDELSKAFRERRDSFPVLQSMTDDAKSSSATKRGTLAAVIKQLGDEGLLQTTKQGGKLIVKDLGTMLKIAA